MPMFESGDVKIEVDEDGFIVDPNHWNEDVARALAGTEGIDELTEEHWGVMNYLRDYYQKFGVAPVSWRGFPSPPVASDPEIRLIPLAAIIQLRRLFSCFQRQSW
mgnify:CR=1 FL=1